MNSILAVTLLGCLSGVLTRTLDTGSVEPMDLTEVTYPGIGHFTLKDFWDPVYRPLVLLPQSPEHINTKFLLHTRSNLKDAQYLKNDDHDSIKNSHFNAKNPTKFIVHGFLDNQLFGDWMRQMKDEFLMAGDYNVIIVDWSGGNGLPYTQATANTRVVGPVIALLINDLKTVAGLDVANVHILGHSLGSHVAGYAGEKLNGTIGRLTGLDPAGPYFEGLPAAAKLDATDGVFVDAIHTDARHLIPDLGFGTYETSGHLDFYPNGGKNQPGCDQQRWTSIITGGLAEGARRLVACNHQRAVDFYMTSINHKYTKAVSYECTDYDAFLAGKCTECGAGDKCAVLGEDALQSKQYQKTTKDQRFFLATTGTFPYFKNQYEIQIKMAAEGDKRLANHGTAIVTLHSAKEDEEINLNDSDQIFHLGQTYTFIKDLDNLGDIKSVTFRWHRTLGIIIHDNMWVDSIRVVPLTSDNILDKSKHQAEIKNFCAATRDAAIENEKNVEFATACN